MQDTTSPVFVSYTVTQQTQGVPSMMYLVLSLDGVPASPLQGSDVTPTTVSSEKTQCHGQCYFKEINVLKRVL